MVNGVLMISDLTPKGKTVPPEFEPPLRRIFDTALWAQEFRATVVPVLEKLDREGFFTFVELMVSEAAHAMRQAGKEWVAGFYALTGQPRAQGFYTGKLIGEACGMVLRSAVEETTGVSPLVGTRAAKRIKEYANKRLPNIKRPPHGLDETIREATEELVKRGEPAPGRAARGAGQVADELAKSTRAAAQAVAKKLDEANDFVRALRHKLGSLPQALDAFTRTEWAEILTRARALKGVKSESSVPMLKGQIAEVLFRHHPKFDALRREFVRDLKGNGYWREEVVFVPRPQARIQMKDGKIMEGELTDGLFVAYATAPRPGQPKVRILGVLESKSPSNIRDLVVERKAKGEPQSWSGQLTRDFERLSELPVLIDGTWYSPDDVALSRTRRNTRWVIGLPRNRYLTDFQLKRLETQGFSPDVWTLPVGDVELNKVANKVLQIVENEVD